MKPESDHTRTANREHLRNAAAVSLQSAETMLKILIESYDKGFSLKSQREYATLIKKIEKLKSELLAVKV